ncbi:MAG: hypothetical protein M3458_24245 [Acidobacteriota bacterium]|nr:hypothetical protein [Acidobacteriota bacterium]
MFDCIGGYSTVLHRVAGDDMLLLQMVKAQPGLGRIVFADDPGTRNRTYPETSWRAFRNQRARWASSGTHHFRGDRLFMAYALCSLVVNMTVLCGGLWAWAGWLRWPVWLATVALKLGVDSMFFAAALRRFDRLRLLRYLPVWFVAQPFYILAQAVWSQRQHWSWKADGQQPRQPVFDAGASN